MPFDSKELKPLGHSDGEAREWDRMRAEARELRAELIVLRAKVAAAEKLRRVCDELPELTYFVEGTREHTRCLDCQAEIVFGGETRHGGSCAVSLFRNTLDEFDAAVSSK